MADRFDIEGIITEIVQPMIMEEVVLPTMDELNTMFTQNTNVLSGTRITDTQAISMTSGSGAGAFTRNDADPSSMTETYQQPYWDKVYYANAVNIRREDIQESLSPSVMTDVVARGVRQSTKLMMEDVFDGVLTQVAADVDDTSTYGSTTRITATSSYVEDTDTTITLAQIRAMMKALALKKQINWKEYVLLMEQTVMNSAQPLMSATGSWLENNPRQGGNMSNVGPGGVASGYLPIGSFDGVPVAQSPFGMTVGDIYALNKSDVQLMTHLPYEIQQKDPDEFGLRFVVRIGVNCWVRHPAWQGKMTDKD